MKFKLYERQKVSNIKNNKPAGPSIVKETEHISNKYYCIVCLNSIQFNTCWEVTNDDGVLDISLLKFSGVYTSNEIPNISDGIGDIPVAWYFYNTKKDAICRPITAPSGISYEDGASEYGMPCDFTLFYEADCEQWVLIMPKVDYYLDAGSEADWAEICSEIVKALIECR